jgi:hypothetical protein
MKLHEYSGSDYITKGRWKKQLRMYVENKHHENPGKYTREVDATTFEQLIDMVCHPDHWPRWADALKDAYPDGVDEARLFYDGSRLSETTYRMGKYVRHGSLNRQYATPTISRIA